MCKAKWALQSLRAVSITFDSGKWQATEKLRARRPSNQKRKAADPPTNKQNKINKTRPTKETKQANGADIIISRTYEPTSKKTKKQNSKRKQIKKPTNQQTNKPENNKPETNKPTHKQKTQKPNRPTLCAACVP